MGLGRQKLIEVKKTYDKRDEDLIRWVAPSLASYIGMFNYSTSLAVNELIKSEAIRELKEELKQELILEQQIKLGVVLIVASAFLAFAFWILFHSPLMTLAMISSLIYGITLVLFTRRMARRYATGRRAS